MGCATFTKFLGFVGVWGPRNRKSKNWGRTPNLGLAGGLLVGVEFNAPHAIITRHNIGHFGGGLHSQSLD